MAGAASSGGAGGDRSGSPAARAVLTGLVLWVAGASLVLLLGATPVYPTIAVPLSLAAAPAMAAITAAHLRGTGPGERLLVALRFGTIVTAVQVPLDAALLWSV